MAVYGKYYNTVVVVSTADGNMRRRVVDDESTMTEVQLYMYVCDEINTKEQNNWCIILYSLSKCTGWSSRQSENVQEEIVLISFQKILLKFPSITSICHSRNFSLNLPKAYTAVGGTTYYYR